MERRIGLNASRFASVRRTSTEDEGPGRDAPTPRIAPRSDTRPFATARRDERRMVPAAAAAPTRLEQVAGDGPADGRFAPVRTTRSSPTPVGAPHRKLRVPVLDGSALSRAHRCSRHALVRMSVVAVGAVLGLALGIVVGVTTDLPLAPEGGVVLGALLGWLRRRRRP